MRRREFVGLVGGVAAWPLAARAQQPDRPVIGILAIGTPTSYDLSAYHQGLKEAGYVEGQNLTIEYRFANDDPTRLAELASDLVRHRVRVIVAVASGLAALAAKDATKTTPIVFGYSADPVKQGLVASLNRPGGNVTGVTSLASELYGKQLGIMHELLPHAANFGVLAYSKSSIHELIVKETQVAASVLGLTIEILDAGSDADIDAQFQRLGDEKRVQALLGANLHSARRSRRHRLPLPAGSFIEGFRTPATVQAASLRSAGIRNPQHFQLMHCNKIGGFPNADLCEIDRSPVESGGSRPA